MRIVPAKQSKLPPPDKPEVENPVRVYMDIPLFYATERGPIPWEHSIFCGSTFAVTVLTAINNLFLTKKLGLAHLGFYNPRRARRKDGTIIQPERWSNHAYGEAMDWKGVVTENGEFHSVNLIYDIFAMDRELLQEVWSLCTEVIRDIGREPEIVNEGSWIHIGIWPSTETRRSSWHYQP